MIFHKIFSYLLLVVIVPLWIAVGLLGFAYNLLNCFYYKNFWYQIEVPQSLFEKYGTDMKIQIVARLAAIIVVNVRNLFEHIAQIKEIEL
jgi:hypothetical protein